MYDTRQEFKQTQDMEPLAFIQSMSGGRGEKTTFEPETTISRRVSTNRKSHGRTYKQAGKDSEAAITNNQEIPQKASKKDKPSVNILGKKKTLATDIKMYLNDKLLSPIKEDSGKVEQERGRRSVTPDYMTPFIRHSFSVCPNQSYRTASGDVTCEQKCTTCAATVLQAHNTTQAEVGRPVVAQEAAIEKKDDCEAKTGCVPLPTRQEITLPRSVRKKFFQSALTRPSFVPTPPPPAQKQNHIWRIYLEHPRERNRLEAKGGQRFFEAGKSTLQPNKGKFRVQRPKRDTFLRKRCKISEPPIFVSSGDKQHRGSKWKK